MPRFRLFAAVVLVLSYSTAIAVPCQSTDRAGRVVAAAAETAPAHGAHAHGAHHADATTDDAGAHAHHGSAVDADEPPCHEPPALIPVCPCGCDQKSSSQTPGGRLDKSLFVAAIPVPPTFASSAGTPLLQRVPAQITTERDKIPIRRFSPIRS